MQTNRGQEAIDAERCQIIMNIEEVHQALGMMHKEVSEGNRSRCRLAQIIHNANSNVLSLNIDVGGYVMVRVCTKGNHKLQSKWKKPMRVIDAKNDLLSVLENLNDASTLIAHAQRIVPYSVSDRASQSSLELKHQAAHHDTTYHLVDSIMKVRKPGGAFDVLVKLLGFEAGRGETWEPIGTVGDDSPGGLEDLLHTFCDCNLKR